MDMRGAIVFLAAGLAMALPCHSADAAHAAIDYLAREVPRWQPENHCFSCHNNGDAARALLLAKARGYDVPPGALADTLEWLRKPAAWDDAHANPGFSDRKLARIQFSAALAEAVRGGAAAASERFGARGRTAAAITGERWRVEDRYRRSNRSAGHLWIGTGHLHGEAHARNRGSGSLPSCDRERQPLAACDCAGQRARPRGDFAGSTGYRGETLGAAARRAERRRRLGSAAPRAIGSFRRGRYAARLEGSQRHHAGGSHRAGTSVSREVPTQRRIVA